MMARTQVGFNIAAIVLEEESSGSRGWLTWRDILIVLDMACCLVIFLPVIWSISHLKEVAEMDGKGVCECVFVFTVC